LTSASQEDWAETVATQPRARTIFIMVAVVVVVVVGGLVFAGEVLGQARQPGLVDGPKSVVRRRRSAVECH
jgi:hypothetical protein